MEIDRRPFLWGLGALVLGIPLGGCEERERRGYAARSPVSGGAVDVRARGLPGCYTPGMDPQGVAQVAETCVATEANIEGPYYREGAPSLSDLRPARAPGVPLVVSGHVRSLDCRSVLAGATIDLWQADAAGHYDNDGSMDAAVLRFRGVVQTDERGAFSVTTIVPGRYLNGRTYRPAHIHVKLSAAGHRPLTTQLYFPDDPFNEGDPFIRSSLVMDVEGDAAGRRAAYDFVMSPQG